MPPNDADWLPAELPSEESGETNPTAEAREVVSRLNGRGLYTRTGLLLLPHNWLGREGEVAVRLGAAHVNYQAWKVGRLAPGQNFLMYSVQRLIEELDALCQEPHPYRTLLVSVFDLPLSALTPAERRIFWTFLFGTFSKRPRAVLLALPGAAAVLPDDHEQAAWRAAGRLAHWPS
ncbi:hypothetical protein [Deinococcus planocerae]|uniref:hypothetical protein n=1 Tax=Deinococcus planocerae TaxID=1737569 RepID=UPI000C7EF0A3|nr:hypothetical protein [Deinococcus planocerae]